MRMRLERNRCFRRLCRTNFFLLGSIGICCFVILIGASFFATSTTGWHPLEKEQQDRLFLRPQNFSGTVRNRRSDKNGSSRSSRLCLPSNIHLSPATNVDVTTNHHHHHHPNVSMTVSFTLPDLPECSKDAVTPKVFYGHRGQSLLVRVMDSMVVPNESFQFQYTNYLQTFQSSWIHHAVLEDLRGGAEPYWYQIRVETASKEPGTDSDRAVSLVQSVVYNFTTPPLPSERVRIALIADWGGSREAIRTMKRMLSRTLPPVLNSSLPPLSAVMVAGDISYANSHLPLWEAWLDHMQPLFSSTPLLVAAGNHEIECNRKTWQVFQAYDSYFRVPNRIAAAHLEPIPPQVSDCTHPAEFMTTYRYGNSFYSYRHGALQMIVLNSYTDTQPGSVQYEWLKHELETNVDRSVTPWLLVVFHCPFHTTFRGHNDERNPRLMMESMEPLFVQHRVNLVLSGHNHGYVRSYPIVGKKSSIDPSKGPIYLTIGTGGDSHAKGPLRPYDPWVAHRDNTEFGFGELMVVNATYAYFQRILNNDNNDDDDDDDDDHPVNPDARDAVWIRNFVFS